MYNQAQGLNSKETSSLLNEVKPLLNPNLNCQAPKDRYSIEQKFFVLLHFVSNNQTMVFLASIMTAWFPIVPEGGAGGLMMTVPGGGMPGGRGPEGGCGLGVVTLGPGGPTGPIGLSGQVVQYLTLLHRSSHRGWKGLGKNNIDNDNITLSSAISLFILAKFSFIWVKCA